MLTARRAIAALPWLALLALLSPSAAEDPGFTAPDGFEVSLFAGDDLAHDVYTLTVDARGRVVVAGRGYVRTLHDRDGDGRADDATLFSDRPRNGARGMFFDGDDLICAGDEGLHRFRDRDGDGIADGPGELWLPSRHTGDHAANGIVKGPDGWFYWICGNDAGITTAHANLPGSPVKDPNCGALVRVAPGGSSSEVLADGFRNPYDLDFNALGHVFTYDADGERIHHLPWYSPTRIFDIARGMHHGWVLKGWQHAWNRPAYILDSVERLSEVGRGSPTGVLVYRHHGFPRRYRGGLFAMCWSFGRIYFFPLKRRGSTYETEMEVFMETRGASGFAPVDMAVGPAGDLFVAIGGRGTRGSVFRIHHAGPEDRPVVRRTPLRRVLGAAQPLSSWSRARWQPQARELGRDPFVAAAIDRSLPSIERIRALEILVELFGGVTARLARRLGAGDPELRARAVWAVSRSPDSPAARRFLVDGTRVADPRVARAAWEALMSLPSPLGIDGPQPDWLGGFEHADRRVRAAAILAARGPGRHAFERQAGALEGLEKPRHIIGSLHARGPERQGDPRWRERYLDACRRAFVTTMDPGERLDAVRLLQLGIGDVDLVQDQPRVSDGFVGRWTDRVDPSTRRSLASKLAACFPAGQGDLDRELARLFAMLEVEVPGLLSRFVPLWTPTSPVEDDIHFLLAAARIPGARPPEFTRAVASALASLQEKLRVHRKEPSRFWPVRVAGAFRELVGRDPALVEALTGDADFGRSEHCLFVAEMSGSRRLAATRRLLSRASGGDDPGSWTPELVSLVGALPEREGFGALRERWADLALRDSIALALARQPDPVDRERLVEALDSRLAPVVSRVARGLRALPAAASPAEIRRALEALRLFSAFKNEAAVRRDLSNLLSHWSGQRPEIREGDDPHRSYRPWFDWFRRAHPDESELLTTPADTDVAAWLARLRRVPWDAGQAAAGERVFRLRNCHGCHAGARRLGPELKGVTSRLSLEDLFVSIVDPGRDVSPTYASKVVVTRTGEVHSGLMVYQSPATSLVQTSPETTVRVKGDEILEVRSSRSSFMPGGLLDGLGDRELADLYAYLKTLR